MSGRQGTGRQGTGRPGTGAEARRLADANVGTAPWRRWGPYLAERAWGTVREDYSADGEPWEYFPHDHARSRAYRWNEDGLAGISDDEQLWCFAVAFWNGRDPFLKERAFGLTGKQGNHGEDAKDYWFYQDCTPTHSFMRWRYHYPQAAFPYEQLVAENGARTKAESEYELADTGIFDDGRYWIVDIEYAKAAPDDLLIRIKVCNNGPQSDTLHVLPTLWFRNTWAWGLPGQQDAPAIHGVDGCLVAEHERVGSLCLAGDGEPDTLLCDNETNTERLYGVSGRSRYPKDGIGDHVVHGLPTVNPDSLGTKGALHYVCDVPARGTVEIRLRLSVGTTEQDLGAEFASVFADREREADAFYADLMPAGVTADEALVTRQALAGLLWSKQFYYYDVEQWLDGDPDGPAPSPRRRSGRNAGWWHLNNADVISVPDKWEFPWYASWDLAFHTVVLARVDPEFAKAQLLLICREWYMHPNGQLPAYEWAFGDVNPPVHAWAALQVFQIDGSTDYEWLERLFHKLLLNFTWWVNRKDSDGSNIFEGGFLGLDNIGPIDRSAVPLGAGHLEQSDATGWMAMFCLNMLQIATTLACHDQAYEDLATKFLEHFAYIAAAAQQIWHEEDGFFYDTLRTEGGAAVPMRVCSAVGLIPLAATAILEPDAMQRLPFFAEHLDWFLENRPQRSAGVITDLTAGGRRLLTVVTAKQLRRVLQRLLDPEQLLSPHGLRSLSARHRDEPFLLRIGGVRATVDYEPGESATGLFGGNSNWRGPVWFPLNYIVIGALRCFDSFYGDELTIEYPQGSGRPATLGAIADDLTARMIGIFTAGADGRRAVFGGRELFADDPNWRDLIPFHEYFHGDTGAGLGASHQTGWTALVADMILGRSSPPAG